MNNQIKKINLNHSFIFFLLCNIFSIIAFKITYLIISPLICLLLILSIGVSHGSLDNLKGRKLFQIFRIDHEKLKEYQKLFLARIDKYYSLIKK